MASKIVGSGPVPVFMGDQQIGTADSFTCDVAGVTPEVATADFTLQMGYDYYSTGTASVGVNPQAEALLTVPSGAGDVVLAARLTEAFDRLLGQRLGVLADCLASCAEEAGLLRGVLAGEQKAVRLYADWLEDRGLYQRADRVRAHADPEGES